MTPGHWKAVRTNAGYHLLLMGANNEIVLTSEVYTDAESVQNAINVAAATVFRDQEQHFRTGEVPGMEIVDERTIEAVQVRNKTYMALCSNPGCDWAAASLDRNVRASEVGYHRTRTGHSVRQYEEMR